MKIVIGRLDKQFQVMVVDVAPWLLMVVSCDNTSCAFAMFSQGWRTAQKTLQILCHHTTAFFP